MVPLSQSAPGSDRSGAAAVCTILAGANGSGKSSIFHALSLPGRFINADIVARHLDPSNPERVSFAAGKVVLRELTKAIQAQQDFVYETTLSSHQSIELIRRAIDTGYEVGLVFVALRDVDLHIARVAQRVSEGGHDIPEPVIRRRYDISMQRLVDAIRLAHGTMVFDNSFISGPLLLLQISKDIIEVNNLDDVQQLHVRIAATVGEALEISPDAVFRAARPDVP
jgi:predicted ABC-type ATPase